MNTNNKYKRTTLIINPRFQMIFLTFMIATSFFIIFEVYLANSYFFWKFQQLGENLHLTPDNIFFQFLRQQKNSMNWIFVALSVTVFVSLTILGLIFSHRIAGQIHHLKTHLLKSAKTGTLETIKFRKRDFFHEIATAYNAMVSKMNSK